MSRLSSCAPAAHALRLLFTLALLAAGLAARPAPLSATSAPTALAAAGDEQWDDRFGMLGTDEPVTAAASTADGTLYVIVRERYVLRWDGRSWQQIGDVGAIGAVRAIALMGGRLYVAGAFTQFGGAPIRYLASWDGGAWSQVGSGEGPQIADGFTQPEINALAAAGGTLYVGGHFDSIDGVGATSVAAWDGSAWSALSGGLQKRLTFGTGQELITPGIVETIVPAGDALYVGGDFKLAGGQEASSIAVWRNGAWSALGTGIALEQEREESNEWATVHAIAVSGTTVYAGGKFTRAGGKFINNLAAWDGATWNALGGGISNDFLDQVNALLLDGATLHVAGRFSVVGGQFANYARWTGGAWQAGATLEGDANLEVHALAPAPGGIYIGGNFNTLDGMLVGNVARWDGERWRALGQGVFTTNSRCCAGQIFATATDAAGRIYVAGRFDYAGEQPVNNIAMWDGERWHDMGGGVGDAPGRAVRDLLLVGDDLYVAGDFTTAGGAAIAYIARYNTVTGQWSRLGSGVSGSVYSLEYAGGTLYAGGDFDSAGGVPANNIAAWDGTRWSALSEKLVIREVGDECRELGTQVYTIKASGRYLAIGGHFRLVQVGFDDPCAVTSYAPANNILLWDRLADEWFFLGPQGAYGVTDGGFLFPSVSALEVVGPELERGGALYVGGEFNQAGPVNSPNLARFTLEGGWEALGGATGGSGVYALAAAGSELFVGGSFTAAGDTPAKNLARYDVATGSWSALGSGASDAGGADATVYALGVTPGGLNVGGDFTLAGGRSAMAFGRWAAPAAAAVVGANGGTLNGERLSVQIPAGAVANGTTVRASSRLAPVAPAPQGQVVVRGFALGATDGAGQPLAQLGQPARLRLTYSDAELATLGVADPATLKVIAWDGARWVELPACEGCGVDTAQRSVTAASAQLTEFALVGASAGPAGEFRLHLPLLRR